MPYGWAGTNLEVDLSSGKIEKQQGDPKLYSDYLGGKGYNAKLFWDRVPPEADAFSPDNLLIFGTGVLSATMVPSANRTCITFKSPVTGMHYFSTFGGFLAPEMKHAGYQTIIISGKSPTPVYLWINDDKVEIRDASHLWGKGTHETQRILREELKNNKVQIVCVGPAGENKVYMASIEHGAGASASRAGVGAVMGDKNLKAIAVYGTRDVNIANSSRLTELCEYILGRTGPLREVIEKFAELHGREMAGMYYGNLNLMYREIPRDSEFRQIIRNACYNCGIRCKSVSPRSDGGYTFIKCLSRTYPLVCDKSIDWNFGTRCHELCEEYGLDSVSVGRTIAFAIELYEKGILTKAETDGMDLEWGNQEVFLSLIEKIIRREGFGDILANGTHGAACQIGKGAEEYAHLSKKLELIAGPIAEYSPFWALEQAISDKADPTRNMSIVSQMTWLEPKEEREAYINSGFFCYPQEFEKYFMEDFDFIGADPEAGCQIASYDEETFTITDLTGLCNFWTVFFPYPPINSRSLIADLLSCVTGMDTDEVELTKIARRTVNLVRASKVRAGLKRKDDTVPKMFFQRTPPPPWQTLNPDKFNEWIDRFYEIRGWSSEGIPTKETLEELGLDYVSQDLERRGILTG